MIDLNWYLVKKKNYAKPGQRQNERGEGQGFENAVLKIK